MLFYSCSYYLEQEVDTRELIFYTDIMIGEDRSVLLQINGDVIGDITFDDILPSCDNLNHLRYASSNEDLELSIIINEEVIHHIGTINLFTVSQGIKIKPTEQGNINVNMQLDDSCARVKLRW